MNNSDINKELEVITKVLGKGKTTPKAYEKSKKLLQYFREPCAEKMNYNRLASSNVAEFKKIDGIGKDTAAFLESVIEFSKKLQSYSAENFPTVCSPEDVANMMMSEMRYYKKEVFKVLLLDTKNRLIRIETISSGILDASLVHPREVFKPAIDHLASSIIIVHNHPSGNPTPSSQDIEITKNLVEAGKIINLEVCDSVIIGDGKYISLKEKKFI